MKVVASYCVVARRSPVIAPRLYHLLSCLNLNYEIIDGYEIGIRRPDVHASETDCLHSNGMAVGDAYSTVLLHHLSSSRTMEDVSKVGNYSYNFSRIANVRPDGGDFDWNIVNG